MAMTPSDREGATSGPQPKAPPVQPTAPPIPRTTFRCFAAGRNGVHGISMENAVDIVQRVGRAPDQPQPEQFIWIDISHPGEQEATLLRDRFGLHPLAVEDALRGRQRPKIERYPGYFFVVFYGVRLKSGRRRLALQEVHLFVGNGFLITVHDRELPEVAKVIAAWKANPARAADSGAAAHSLLDAIVDDYFPIVEHFSERLNHLEDQIFTGSSATGGVFPLIELRHELILMRRIISPEREIISSLLRHDLPFLRPDFIPYFQDVYDHLQRVTEEIDTFRDLLTGLLEVQSSVASNRLNQTVQTLTAWSIILMSIAVIAGVYGMNFVRMPELRLAWGYYAALGLMAGVGMSLALFFRHRGWL